MIGTKGTLRGKGSLDLTRRSWQRNHGQVADLLAQLVQREVALRYRGAFLGLFGSLVNPLLMLATYALVFGWIFNGHYYLKPNETRADYVIGLFCGLVIFNYFSECLNRAPTLILAYPNYIKKVVFPLEIIPISVNFAAIFHLAISFVPLLFAIVFFGGGIKPGALWLIVILFPLFLLAQAALWILSALGVFVRDIGLLIGTFTQILMFGSAIFYTIATLPYPFRNLIALNPLAQICEMARTALVVGQGPNLGNLVLVIGVSSIMCVAGSELFRRCRPAFADVI